MAKDYAPKVLLSMKEEDLEKDIEKWPDILFGGKDALYWLMARKQARQANTIRQLTWWIFGFTLVVTLAALLNLAIALEWIGQSSIP